MKNLQKAPRAVLVFSSESLGLSFAGIMFVAAVMSLMVGIWVEDVRWYWTGALLVFTALAALGVSLLILADNDTINVPMPWRKRAEDFTPLKEES